MLKVVATDIPAYQKLLLEKITDILEINEIESMVILSTLKDSTPTLTLTKENEAKCLRLKAFGLAIESLLHDLGFTCSCNFQHPMGYLLSPFHIKDIVK